MEEYIKALTESFELNANTERAQKQSKYMKFHFEYYGIITPLRNQLTRPFYSKSLCLLKKN